MKGLEQILNEWLRELELPERIERAKNYFKDVFGIEPTYITTSKKSVVVRRELDMSELEKYPSIMMLVEKIGGYYLNGEEVTGVVLIVEEKGSEDVEHGWEVYDVAFEDYDSVVREKIEGEYLIKIVIKGSRL